MDGDLGRTAGKPGQIGLSTAGCLVDQRAHRLAAMDTAGIKRTLFSVNDFLGWQRDGTLDLNPPFQRRSVWRSGAKSYLVDTVYRGLPVPLIFIRERLDVNSMQTIREVIDGQQRLRTLFAFIDPKVLSDFDEESDSFTVNRNHNHELAGKAFAKLGVDAKARLLGYEFSTHVLPAATEDRDVLTIFARINSTGTTLNRQELRNAKFFGAFKTLMYELSYEQLERWLGWSVLTEDQVARMTEVELTSDLVQNMIEGTTGKSQPRLDKLYERFDSRFPRQGEVARRFRSTMREIDDTIGKDLPDTVFSREVNFFTLFTFCYDRLWGLGSDLSRRPASRLPKQLRRKLLTASKDLRSQDVPDEVLDAIRRASADLGRRQTRLAYLRSVCNGSGS